MRGWMVAAGVAAGLIGREMYRRRNALELRGKVVAITGGSRGLGFALAQEFARHGARLAICARTPEPLERARQELERMGAEVLAYRCDVSDRSQAAAFIRAVTERYEQLDVLVNNAGVISAGPIETQTIEDFEEAMAVMFWGTAYPTLVALPRMMAKRGGRIVNITSIGGKVAVPHLSSYACAKFAAVGFSEAMKAELAEHGISVVTVVPGLMRTGSHVNAFFKGKHRIEYGWFSPLASMPFVSIDAREAARKIVEATRRGDAEITLTIPANLLARFHGLFPGLTADLMGLVDRVLPGPGGIGSARARGWESQSWVSPSVLTTLGDRAAEELNQVPLEAGTRPPEGASGART